MTIRVTWEKKRTGTFSLVERNLAIDDIRRYNEKTATCLVWPSHSPHIYILAGKKLLPMHLDS